jgi:hydroxyethylthiazole kinase-like uncharacterized protein yjeF
VSLPDWLAPLPDAAQQRQLDRWAIEHRRIPSLELMERAGEALARVAHQRAPRGLIAVVCGKGNNGGDGYVAARLLRQRGREVRVLALAGAHELSGDALANFNLLPGDPPQPFGEQTLAGAAAIIDAVLGTGFAGVPREPAAGAIEAICRRRAAGSLVIACDVPSGVDASTGEVAKMAVRADVTVTFHAAKPGLWIAPGKNHAGELEVVDIGIPAGGPCQPQIGLLNETVLARVPRRDAAATKFSAGALLVCGGSSGLTGAPSLSAEAAMRAGAGYVTALVPASLAVIFESRLLEVMTHALADRDGALAPAGLAAALQRCERAQALVLGPGVGRTQHAVALVRQLAARAPIPLLLDADGLNAHAGELEALAARRAPTVLTPHAGELARLLGCSSEEVSNRRLACARTAASTAGAVVVLKGDDTLVAAPDGRVAISAGGAPALATAGSGDVLSGVIGAYLAKGMGPFEAACAGVALHTAAGRLAARRVGPEGVVASDVIACLPAAFADALRGEW